MLGPEHHAAIRSPPRTIPPNTQITAASHSALSAPLLQAQHETAGAEHRQGRQTLTTGDRTHTHTRETGVVA